MERKQIEQFFIKKYDGDEHIIDAMSKKSDDELISLYNINMLREENEKEIEENGSVTYIIDFDENESEQVEKFMWNNGMFSIRDGRFNYRCSNDGRLVNVPEKFIKELEKHFKVKRSKESYVLGENDLNNFKEGDKVSILVYGIFGASKDQGTICNVDDDSITIRKYRNKKQGYVFSIGEEVVINKLSKFIKSA